MSNITDIIEDAISACELTLYGIDQSGGATMVYIENPEGDVSISDCEAVMRQINYTADTQDLHIEVSSKGVCPLLLSTTHYQNAIGHPVKIRTKTQSFSGVLTDIAEETLILHKGEHTFNIELSAVETARLLPTQRGE